MAAMPAIAGRAEHGVHAGFTGELPDEGVLTAAAANYEDLHAPVQRGARPMGH